MPALAVDHVDSCLCCVADEEGRRPESVELTCLIRAIVIFPSTKSYVRPIQQEPPDPPAYLRCCTEGCLADGESVEKLS